MRKNKNYETVQPKILNKTGVVDLNYVKRAEMKAKEIIEIKKNKERVKK